LRTSIVPKKSVRKSSTKAPKSVDAYLAALDVEPRAALERLRRIIRAEFPAAAEECISYGMPAFKLDGKAFVWFAAAAKHCALYGVSNEDADLASYDTSGRGTLRFDPAQPLPTALVKKLVRARLARTTMRAPSRDTKAREVAVPADLERALRSMARAWKRWQSLGYTHRREHAEAVTGAKKPETRVRRIERIFEPLLQRD
jgi:uncharacterized protein YdhG (YjbR/CyaY superfamily)